MTFAETDNHHAEDSASDHADAFTALIGQARMSRLNLLHYHRDEAQAGGRLLLQAAKRRGGNEIAVLFDEWDGAPLAMLQQRLDEAVHAADPGATPYFGDLPGALAHWQHEQGLRFFVILHGFERHLARNADASDVAEFDRALIRLASDPMLELHILLCIDEDAAPMLDRLRPFLPDLGQEYLRMPELPGAATQQAATAQESSTANASGSLTSAASMPPAIGPGSLAPASGAHAEKEPTLPILPLTADLPGVDMPAEPAQGTRARDAQPESINSGDKAASDHADASELVYTRKPPRRRRDFSSLLETLDAAPLAQPAHGKEANPAREVNVAIPTPSFRGQPTRLLPWFHDRIRRRRLTIMKLTTNGILTATAILFVLLIVGMLAWTLRQAPGHSSAAQPAGNNNAYVLHLAASKVQTVLSSVN